MLESKPSTSTPERSGPPLFRYLPAGKRRPSQYEEVTVHTQWSPTTYATQGFFCRGPGGRQVWDPRSTRITAGDWWGFRDPHQLWYRPYVEMQARSEDSIELASDGAHLSGALQNITEAWRDVLGRYYGAYRFYEYGLFLSLSYVQREALSDVVGTTAVFQGMDRDRHAQAIALHCMDLEEAIPGFSSEGSRAAWLQDPMLQPSREFVERLMACRDWVEILVAINLVLDPLVSVLLTRSFFARLAPRHGDTVTPVILDTVEIDRKRHLDTISALVRFLIADTGSNRAIIQGWVDAWLPLARRAQQALRPLYERLEESTFDGHLRTVGEDWASLVAASGLRAEMEFSR